MAPPLILSGWLIKIAITERDDPKMGLAPGIALFVFFFAGLPAGLIVLTNIVQHLLPARNLNQRMFECEILKSTIATLWCLLLCFSMLGASIMIALPIALLGLIVVGILFYLPLLYAYRAWRNGTEPDAITHRNNRQPHGPHTAALEEGINEHMGRQVARLEGRSGGSRTNIAKKADDAEGTEQTPLLKEWIQLRK
jgi:hypothetical protein